MAAAAASKPACGQPRGSSTLSLTAQSGTWTTPHARMPARAPDVLGSAPSHSLTEPTGPRDPRSRPARRATPALKGHQLNEQWKPVPDYEGIYEVSDQGNVRSLDRIDAAGNRRLGRARKPVTKPSGYLKVDLSRDAVERGYFVHRLVLTAFVGPAPDGMETRHGDGDPTNNALSNLSWGTHAANISDQVTHGTHREARKIECLRGHAYDDENTLLRPDGRRTCRVCMRDRRRRSHRIRQMQGAT